MVEPVAVAALAIDALFGWPGWLYARIGHPVGLFARWLAWTERRWNDHRRSFAMRRVAGIASLLFLVVAVGLACWLIERTLTHWLGSYAWIAIALLGAPALALRSLHDHVAPVQSALASGDLSAARHHVSMIVGRDTAALDEAGVARAAIESLSESLCDGVVAPLFWLLVLGLPGAWMYKAINTADSMIGHREERWRAFGWCAARTDDLANLIPARLSAVLLCVAGGGGWRILWRDAGKHASPNAGWPEAAMAGALDIRLAGPIRYDGVPHDKPWIGDGREALTAADIGTALRIYRRTGWMLLVMAGGIAWAL